MQRVSQIGDFCRIAGRLGSSVWLLAAQAIDELLNRTKWRVVFFALLLQKREGGTKLCMQPIRPDCSQDSLNVGLPFRRGSEKMKNRPVMPNIICMARELHTGYVSHQPRDVFSALID